VLFRSLASGASPAEVYLDVLSPALRAIGAGWAAGTVSIADEHRASVVASRLLGRLGPQFARPGRKRGTVIVGAPAKEDHALPGAILADMLRGAGFDVMDLGANTPSASFVEAAEATGRLVAVVIGATTPGNDRNVAAAVRALHGAGIDAPVLVGGGAIDDGEHSRRLGADGWTGPAAAPAHAAVEAAAESRR